MKKKNALLKTARGIKEPKLYVKTPGNEAFRKALKGGLVGTLMGGAISGGWGVNPKVSLPVGAGAGMLVGLGESLLDSTKMNKLRRAKEYSEESKSIQKNMKNYNPLISDRLKNVAGGVMMMAPLGLAAGSVYPNKFKTRNALIGTGIGAGLGAGLGMLSNKYNKKK